MRIDLDTYREILDTLTRNKSRSFLTGFGVFWGVFMLVALMGGGQGLKEKLQQNFAGFAAIAPWYGHSLRARRTRVFAKVAIGIWTTMTLHASDTVCQNLM